jgi:hypothetical protein
MRRRIYPTQMNQNNIVLTMNLPMIFVMILSINARLHLNTDSLGDCC